ncbi:MAG TPA: uracil-DNA glycosylase family protein [Fulvivirga sp.]|nr:uracil-DNA glycosylase family protein [Fulvivirga sp.]
MDNLLTEIRQCTVCEPKMGHKARPVLSISKQSKILIIGQAPGAKVHASGIPWQDASGNILREWLGISNEEFYNPDIIGILPMGFCYPGKGKSGDLPPRPECAPLWHGKVLKQLKEVKLTLLIGQYAQKYYLGVRSGKNLTETVKNFKDYLPQYFPLPHPSPRNRFWMAKNPWFQDEVIPLLKSKVLSSLN